MALLSLPALLSEDSWPEVSSGGTLYRWPADAQQAPIRLQVTSLQRLQRAQAQALSVDAPSLVLPLDAGVLALARGRSELAAVLLGR